MTKITDGSGYPRLYVWPEARRPGAALRQYWVLSPGDCPRQTSHQGECLSFKSLYFHQEEDLIRFGYSVKPGAPFVKAG